MSWAVARHRERAGDFHARDLADDPVREVWVNEAPDHALVLGSTQRDEVVDHEACERAGVDVVRRRSGGGAVLVEPGSLVWLDVVVPASDELWQADVGRAFLWLGATWQRALAELGVPSRVHRDGLVRTRWSDLVCFAGLGPGELTAPDGAKLVGISQRRTRAAARFQCALLLRWDPGELLSLLSLSEAEREQATEDLAGAARGVDVDHDDVLAALRRHLPH